jgi:Domain of unknown function(DUF2779)
MPFLITKSLFVDYRKFPKLAWLRVNDLERYRKATKTDSEDMQNYIMELWKTVESLVGDYLHRKYWVEVFNAFPDIPEVTEDIWRLDDDDTWVAEVSFQDRLMQNIGRTKEAVLRWERIIYQPGFQLWDCYVRADYLVLNSEWKYDLIEVKAKSNVRKEVTDDGEKKKIWKIEDEFLNDVAFQKYIINQVFDPWGISQIEKISIAHVNSEYIRNGEIEIDKMLCFQDVWTITSVSVIQKKKNEIITRDDVCDTGRNIQAFIDTIRSELVLSESDFGAIHAFPGNKYLEYFGAEKPFGTIYSIPYSPTVSAIVKELHEKEIIPLEDMPEDILKSMSGKAAEFLQRYFHSSSTPSVDSVDIKTELGALNFPICFYDYESISTPVPLLDWVSPYQQAVVQYSLHKLFEDGRIEHYWAVLVGEWDLHIDEVVWIEDSCMTVQKNRIVVGSQRDFLGLFLDDIWECIDTSSFVVWYKAFENSRNTEIAWSYPEFSDSFLKINDKTYDLYEPFSKYKYFDRKFKWSASIKKVLPILVPELSYDGLAIGKWDKAMNKLAELIRGDISDTEARIQTAKDLLIYCRQDSWAMVEIYRKLLYLG